MNYDTKDLTAELVQNILNGEGTSAVEKMNDIISIKTAQAFESRKIELAQSLYKEDLEAVEEERIDEISKETAQSALDKRLERGINSPKDRYGAYRASTRAAGQKDPLKPRSTSGLGTQKKED